MEYCDLDLDRLFELSRFDYTEWMQRVATEEEACGSVAIRTVMSTYDMFHRLRDSALEDADRITGLPSTFLSGHGLFVDCERAEDPNCLNDDLIDNGLIDCERAEDPNCLNYGLIKNGLIDCESAKDPNCLNHELIDNGHGQSSNSVEAGKPVFDEIVYEHHEDEQSDGRMPFTEICESTCNTYDELADNCTAEGLNEQTKAKRRGGRRHRNHVMKKPMGLAELMSELLDNDRRENALRCLSGHLIERRETDSRFYRTAAYQLYFSCSTLAVLIQEVMAVYERIYEGDLSIRGSKRLANVLTCFQSIASSNETRIPFVRARIPNLLEPFILSTFTEEVYENVRAISLSVIDITCKDCDREVIVWALESDIVQACLYAIEIGSRLSKMIAMSILESILHDEVALGVLCRPDCTLVQGIVKMLSYLVAILGVVQDFSRRLIFQVVRCYTLLCQHPRALEIVKYNFPEQLQDHTFHELKKVYPLFRILLHQLLLCIGKIDTYLPQLSPSDSDTLSTPNTASQARGKENISSEGSLNKPTRSSPNMPSPKTPKSTESPLRPVDLNKEGWHNLPSTFEYV